ncbi:MAG: oligosaccharide flippase family protein [Planctomycetota bacterium]
MSVYKEIRKLFSEGFVFASVGVLQKSVGFFLIPVYTRILSPTDYGIIEIASSTAFFAMLFALLDVPTAMIRSYQYVAGGEEDRDRVVGTAFLTTILTIAGTCGVLLAAIRPLTVFLFDDPAKTALTGVTVLTVFTTAMSRLRTDLFRARAEVKRWAVWEFSLFVLSLVFQILFVVVFRWGPFGAILGSGVSAGIVTVAFIPTFVWAVRRGWSWRHCREMLIFALPLLPGTLALWVISQSNRYFLKEYLDFGQAGIFGISMRLSRAVAMLAEAMLSAWTVNVYRLAREEGSQRVFARFLTYYFLALGYVALGLAVLSQEVVEVMARKVEFQQAYKYVPLIALGYLFFNGRRIVGAHVSICNKNIYKVGLLLVAFVINVAANWTLIPRLGPQGAAIGVFLPYFFLFWSFHAVNLRFARVPYEWGRLLKLAIVFGGLFALASLTASWRILLRLPVKLAILAALIPILWCLGFFQKAELRRGRELLGELRSRVAGRWTPGGDDERVEVED